MMDIAEKKNRIISFLKNAGPSLPVRIAREIKVEPVLASAILSELLGERRVKMSNMKIGTSSLYLIEGQEELLENFSSELRSAEHDAYKRLKERKVLKDSEQEPATRVALRSIKDFAIPFKYNEEILWRYAFAAREDIQKIVLGKDTSPKEPTTSPKPEEEQKEIEEKAPALPKEALAKEEKLEKRPAEEKPVKKEKPKKQVEKIFENEEAEEKPEFYNEILDFLKNKNIEFLEEIQTEKKEVVGKVQITSSLGSIDFLLIAKNKKTISKGEITASVQRATYSKMPALIVIRKEPTKTIQKFVEENNLVKIVVMK